MAKRAKHRSSKTGLPPGTLLHIGEKPSSDVKISAFNYKQDQIEEVEFHAASECRKLKDSTSVSWINIEGIHDEKVLKELGDLFGLHPLVLEDIMNTEQRPKMEDFDDYMYFVLKMLTYEKNGEVSIEQISIILGNNFVLSFQEGKEGDVFTPVRERLRTGKGRICELGADYLAYSLLDAVVDNYFTILEQLEDAIEDLEEGLIDKAAPELLQHIYGMKRKMIFVRKSVWPLREVVAAMERYEGKLIQESTRAYLRDVYDHTIQVIDIVETFRDLLAGMLDLYLSSASNRMNAVMKVLTVIATIFMPLTFIAGVYGMNFKFMPELEWHWGYPATLIVMAIIALIMIIFFKRKEWI